LRRPNPAKGPDALLAGVLLMLALAVPVTAEAQSVAASKESDAAQTRAQLEQLERDITRISTEQRQRESQRSALQGKLRKSEVRLAGISRERVQIQAAIASSSSELRELHKQREALRAQAHQQQAAVALEVRRAWQGGEDDQLRLLIGQEDPASIARMLAYYRYIIGARSELLDEYRATLLSVDTLEQRLAATRQGLERQRNRLGVQQQDLAREQEQRLQLLASIEAQLSSQGLALAAREADREQLEVLLDDIETVLSQIVTLEDVQPFSGAQGKMPWPVDGSITHAFGRARNQGKMRWQGLSFKAEAGATVATIHHGRVVYADWLRGSGLLLVIDHGEGYMSLYAHNESLLREVGDWVSTGAAISTVGNSGGQTEPGLYFEIRKDGTPTDPGRWCGG
jgi:septal ring factor EnvC (AmiA/AmiB activator)